MREKVKLNVKNFSYDDNFITVKSFCEDSMGSKLKRGTKASESQKIYLIEYLEEMPDLANDKFTTIDGSHCLDKEWSSLSEKLNSLGGAIKDGIKWRKYWKDLTVRSKDSAIKEQRHKSGVNGLIPIRELSEVDKRIISIITREAVEGVSASVDEIGFGEIISEEVCCMYVDDPTEPERPSTSRQAGPPITPRTIYGGPPNIVRSTNVPKKKEDTFILYG